MIGCLLGTLGVIGLVKMIRAHRYGCYAGGCGGGGGGWWRHHHRGHGHGHGFFRGHHGWGHHGPGGYGDDGEEMGLGSGGGFGGRTFLRGILDPLEMTPAQERVVFAAFDELREAGGKLRGELRASRKDVASAFRKPVYDEVIFGELYARHDTAMDGLRKAFVGTTARIHDALDERQRARLADLIESGPGYGFSRSRFNW